MPISLVELQANRATIAVETPLGPVDVTYRTHVMTPVKEMELAQILADQESDEDEGEDDQTRIARLVARVETMIGQFCVIVSSVGLTGPMFDDAGNEVVADGQLIPIKPEYVRHFPSELITDALAAIRQQSETKRAEAAEGNDGLPKNGSAPSRNGSRAGSPTRR